eukprot:11212970-Lingulodinium_polyedra.AAC.1
MIGARRGPGAIGQGVAGATMYAAASESQNASGFRSAAVGGVFTRLRFRKSRVGAVAGRFAGDVHVFAHGLSEGVV